MPGLGLVQNKFIGYRIRPDWHSFVVVAVKEYGLTSKTPGLHYTEPLAYCKSLETAVNYIITHSTRLEAANLQNIRFAESGESAVLEALPKAMELATEHALIAIKQLEAKIDKLSLSRYDLVKGLDDLTTQV